MYFQFWAVALAAAAFLSSCSLKPRDIAVVPNPVGMEIRTGTVSLPENIALFTSEPSVFGVVSAYIEQMSRGEGNLYSVASEKTQAFVNLSLDSELEKEEYRLIVDRKGIRVSGGDAAGIWWGLQTMSQIVLQADDSNRIPYIEIQDKPKFAYRGAHLDCCRHFFSVDDVKQYIDIMSLHKLNVLHWHLTDDQGWRIEIKKYPLLTEIGSVRKETLVGRYDETNQTYDGIPYSGFYTQDEIRDVVAYAAVRGITIVPEIEMPGHAVAALASYPHLGCTRGKYEVRTKWGISEDLFCMGKETTFEFLFDVLTEVCELFPGKYIHIGGDECPTAVWDKCRHCRKLMKKQGFETSRQLQSYLLKRVEAFLAEKNRVIIGWDEILDAGVTPTAVVMSWRGTAGGIKAAQMGNNVIMTPNSYCYLDYAQTENPEANGEPLGIGGYVSLRKMYSFDPYEGLSEMEQQHIAGIQANVWTEYMKTFSHVQFMVLPRFSALSENAWSESKTDYDGFLGRVEKSMLPLYGYFGYNVAQYAFKGIE